MRSVMVMGTLVLLGLTCGAEAPTRAPERTGKIVKVALATLAEKEQSILATITINDGKEDVPVSIATDTKLWISKGKLGEIGKPEDFKVGEQVSVWLKKDDKGKLKTEQFMVFRKGEADLPPPPPEFEFSNFQSEGDSVKAEVTGQKVLLRVKSTIGVGRCTITPKRGTWPEEVTVLFEGLGELEQLQLVAGRLFAEGSRKSSGGFELSMLGGDRTVAKRSVVGTLKITVEKQKEDIVVVFPAKLLADTDVVTISWVNFFRR
jgi:hypothetical protein